MDHCYHCMAEIENPNDRFCPECGNEHNVHYSQSFELPAGTYLCDRRYFVGKSLGTGGFGITYLGFDLKINKRIVVKETYYNGISSRNNRNITLENPLRVEYKNDISLDDIMNKTQKECFCLSRAESFNNIVKVYDWFAENNTAYIITEYINGDTLYEKVANKGVYQWDELYRHFRPLLQSLSQLHSMGLLHRDIKPQNIMLRTVYKNKVDFVLIDFGLARTTGHYTTSSKAAFTPGYSPFEQRTLTHKDGTFTDVYSIAATMYYALTGDDPNDSIEGEVLDNFPRLEYLKDSGRISKNVYNAFIAALQPSHRVRCQTIDEFLDMLEDTEDIFTTPIESPYNRTQKKPITSETIYAVNSNTSYTPPKEPFMTYEPPVSNVRTTQQPYYAPVQQTASDSFGFAKTFKVLLCIISVLCLGVMVLDAKDAISFPDLIQLDSQSDDTEKTYNNNNNDSSESTSSNSSLYKMGYYVGKDFDSVKEELEAAGFEVRSQESYNEDLAEGTIIKQFFEEGEYLEKGDTIRFAVSTTSPSGTLVDDDSKQSSSSQSSTSSQSNEEEELTAEFDEDSRTSISNSSTSYVGSYTKPIFHGSYYSSCLAPDYDNYGNYYTYNEKGILYGNDDLCWSEGVSGVGVGEYIEYNDTNIQTVSQCTIINGYNKSSESFNNNGRLTKITFQFSDGTELTYDVDPDYMGEQTFYFGRKINTTYIRMVISGAISGDKYSDTSISFVLPE